MRREMTIIISTVMIMIMANACAPRKDDFEAVFRERLVRHYVEDDKAARDMNGRPLRLDITFVDLDGDGEPEAIVRLNHPAFCGSRGCAIDVVRFEGGRIVVLGAFIAHEAALRHGAMAQRRLVVIDARAWIMSGDQLVPLEP